uniref:Transthyretin-like family protein n=1 Tax=Steinernema glaseri TaxID=37863 RepID=A0A1I7YIE2_9BILA
MPSRRPTNCELERRTLGEGLRWRIPSVMDGVEQLVAFVIQRDSITPRLHLVETIHGVKESLTVLGLMLMRVCSMEECDLINKDYHNNHTRFNKPSCIYKFEEGEEGERRRLYISFECCEPDEQKTGQRNMPASYKGDNDLRLMRV